MHLDEKTLPNKKYKRLNNPNKNENKKPAPSFEKVREKLKQNLAKPENKAVFERLKNK